MKQDFTETDLVEIVEVLRTEFGNQNNLSMFRDIHEHTSKDGTFAGDDHVFSIYDKTESAFYFVVSPFDVKSGKAPQQALVFKNGAVTNNFDYTSYANMRTGALDALLMTVLNRPIGKIVLFGTGSIARWSVRFLKAAFPDIKSMHYINHSQTDDVSFQDFGDACGVQLALTDKSQLDQYSHILLHTNSDKPVLSEADFEWLSPDAVICSYLTSYDFEEVQDSCWDTQKNTVVVSWNREVENSKDLQRAKATGRLVESKLITLEEIINGTVKLPTKGRLLFRSAGTPIQNAAMLKYLISTK